jgi:hypothetical protein
MSTERRPLGPARRATLAILSDLRDRSGIGNAFDDIDDDIVEEIEDSIQEVIEGIFGGDGDNIEMVLNVGGTSVTFPPVSEARAAEISRQLRDAARRRPGADPGWCAS